MTIFKKYIHNFNVGTFSGFYKFFQELKTVPFYVILEKFPTNRMKYTIIDGGEFWRFYKYFQELKKMSLFM